jgi:hydrophobe/amphiphile efflux-1 (HAE1) family protein
MNLSRFFIDRPIFAGVISVLIFLAGAVSLFQLPISEYPEVVPPTVVVKAQFPGANPKVIAETVASPLEEQINGTENMLYMFSQASSDGLLTLTVTFKLGTDPNLAQQLVENRVNQALPRLPDVTRALGVTTVKSSPDLTMVVHLTSPNGRYNMLYLRNYAVLNVKDQLAKIQGVGSVQLFGSGDYAMRVWLNLQKVAERGLTPQEVVASIQRQNVQVSAGVIGGPPYAKGVELQLSINVQGRLQDAEQFDAMIVKRNGGVVTRLSDIARVEIDAAEFGLRSLLDNQSAVAIPIFQAPGSNTIEISNHVRAIVAALKQNFPEGVDYSVVYYPAIFVRGSIEAVVHTLLEALALVVLVVIVFLQTWRASIIPLLAVPVSIIGTFAVMHLFGFSINALSLFGLVLAIGIVVDDHPHPRRDAAEGHGLRVDRAHLPAGDRRQHRDPGVPDLRAAGVPGARREIREPVPAARHHPDRPDVPALGDCRRVAQRRRQQHLHPDRVLRAGRPRVQERHPDRRVRA